MNWKHGYFAESGYTYGYYPETSPARLRWVAALRGIAAPAKGFRYLDLGCGQGLSLALMAAMHPDSEFVGIDFMPEHVAHAQALARQAGLNNVTFIEGDFIEMAQRPEALGQFDYAVAHGITTWIAAEVREGLFTLAGRTLKPGGLMYNSYNTFPGWLPASPFQQLVAQLQKRHSGQQALKLAQSHMAQLKANGSVLFSQLPGLEGRLNGMQQQDAAYLVQEYNNQFWQPVYCSEMLEVAGAHKLDFLVSATLNEVFDNAYPPQLLAQINAESDLITRETLRDVALGQSFRRDVYVKGSHPAWPAEQFKVVTRQRFAISQLVNVPEEGQGFEIKGGTFTLNGNREAYLQVLQAFGTAGASLQAVLDAHPNMNVATLMHITTMLLHGGWLVMDAEDDSSVANWHQAHRMNRALAQSTLQGAPYRYLTLGRALSAVPVSDVDLMLLGLLDNGVSPENLGSALDTAMRANNRRFVVDSVTLETAEQSVPHARAYTQKFVADKLPILRRLGAVA